MIKTKKILENKEEIARMCEQGCFEVDIAKKFGVSKCTLRAYLEEIGITPNLKPRGASNPLEPHLEKILPLIEMCSAEQIGEMFNVSSASVNHFLRSKGIYQQRGKKTANRTQPRRNEIARFYLENNTLQATGDKFGITRERVRQILNAIGIKPRKSSTVVKPFKPRKRLTATERFWLNVDKSGGEDACWNWMLGKVGAGYGRFRFHGKNWSTHTLSFFLANKRKSKKWILHSCDNPACVNPKHLREGTPKENTADRDRRGRSGYQRNREQWLTNLLAAKKEKGRKVLLLDEVREVKRLLRDSTLIPTVIARRFDVAPNTIYNIKSGKTFAEINI